MEEFISVKNECVTTTIIEHSKFICYLKNVENEEDAKEYLKAIRKEHSLATHCCYAYIADEKGFIQKFSDDGEPQGTAGMPILEAIKNNNLVKVIAIVVRYFGGIKLGAGGLVRAYTNSTVSAIKNAQILNYSLAKKLSINCLYENYSKILSLFESEGVVILNTDFSENVEMEFLVKSKQIDSFNYKLSETFSGQILAIEKEEIFYPFKK